jgi:methionine aminotransferase
MIKSKLPNIGTTIFTKMSNLAAEHNAINLSQGFPDFDIHPALAEAITRRVADGYNQYAPMAGALPLREQIAQHTALYRHIQFDPETEITVTPGATEAIFCAVMACVNNGDEVLLFDPCYDSYEPAIELAGGRAIHIPLAEGSFAIDWDKVADAVSPRTRMLIINSPHNPSGNTLTSQDLLNLELLAEKHDLLIISDEV